jgi:nicotinamide-nucleotide adenylyltransferase
MNTKSFNRIGMVARWKPVHLGHLPVLHALCEQAEHALIGIGSSNRYNARNPFTVDETTDMLNLVLASYDNYTLISVPDLDDGPRWRLMILDLFGPLDAYVTANPYVAHLLIEDYALIKPVALVAEAHRIAVDGTMVRREMVRGGPWQDLTPPEITHYILERKLDERFRREFGLETLALDAVIRRQ